MKPAYLDRRRVVRPDVDAKKSPRYRLDDVPVIVVDAAWTIIAGNQMARTFFGGEVVGENAARRQFIGPPWVQREATEEERYERDLVGDLHRQLARHPDDGAVARAHRRA